MSVEIIKTAALGELDPNWYVTEYQDVPLTGLTPQSHFLKYGYQLGRLPKYGYVYPSLRVDSPLQNHLVPANELASIEGAGKTWRSVGDDPFFTLTFEPHPPQAGWSQIDIHLTLESKRGVAKFYFDTGSGFNESETICIPYFSDKPVRRIFRFERDVKAIRFDPKEKEGVFTVQACSFTPIADTAAFGSMLTHLASLQANAGTKPHDVFERLAQTAVEQNKPLWRVVQSSYSDTFSATGASIDYETWIEDMEAPSLPTAAQVQSALEAMTHKPLISIVMPTYNTPEALLRECIESVRSQSYPHWELCIADDSSPRPHVQAVLKSYEAQDERIRVVYRAENGHISRASNSALELAQGEYVALLDHDDTLPEHALYFMAQAINAQPDAQIMYSDEDKIDMSGKRFDPHFKSDWNPDLFYSQNYVSHLGVYKRDLLTRIGGFRAGLEGSQDQDLLLRCLPHVRHEQIVHIPRVLYHWRMVEGSTALASGEKSYTTEAGVRALKDYFAVVNPGVRVEAGMVPNTYRVRWPIPDPAPLVSLLIPTRDRRALTETCVRSILDKSTYQNYEILILDNGSVEPETLAFFEQIQREDLRVRVLRYDHPFNYSAINNFGAQHAKGEILGLVNNDIEVISPEWLTEMVSHAVRPDIGCVGAKLYYSNDTIQHAGVICSIGGVAGHSHKFYPRSRPGYFSRLLLVQNLSAVTAACLLVRKNVFDEVQGLDDVNLKVAFNDVDFCLKVREAGYRNLWTPYAELYHYESISRGAEDSPEKIERFNGEVAFMLDKWGKSIGSDPFYNPNLSKTKEDFSLCCDSD